MVVGHRSGTAPAGLRLNRGLSEQAEAFAAVPRLDDEEDGSNRLKVEQAVAELTASVDPAHQAPASVEASEWPERVNFTSNRGLGSHRYYG